MTFFTTKVFLQYISAVHIVYNFYSLDFCQKYKGILNTIFDSLQTQCCIILQILILNICRKVARY